MIHLRTVVRKAVIATVCVFGAMNLPAQSMAEEVKTVDGIIAALYDVISGPAGQARNWDRWRGLFAPDAQLMPTGRRPNGTHGYRRMTPEQYATSSGPILERDGFFESELGRVTETFGNIVHVFSTYDSKRTLKDEKPFARGINSIQLMFDGQRYWIMSVMWDSERADNPIPGRYLTRKP